MFITACIIPPQEGLIPEWNQTIIDNPIKIHLSIKAYSESFHCCNNFTRCQLVYFYKFYLSTWLLCSKGPKCFRAVVKIHEFYSYEENCRHRCLKIHSYNLRYYRCGCYSEFLQLWKLANESTLKNKSFQQMSSNYVSKLQEFIL